MKYQNFKFWGAVFMALFSASSFAQIPEYLLQATPQNRPYEPPAWFARLAGQPQRYMSDFAFDLPEISKTMGKPHPTKQQKGCLIHDEQGIKKWGFCDL